MDLVLVIASLFAFVVLLVAIGKLFSIERSLHRLVMFELCDKGVFLQGYCERYMKEVAFEAAIPVKGYRKREALVP
jgi:hypothetical protein